MNRTSVWKARAARAALAILALLPVLFPRPGAAQSPPDSAAAVARRFLDAMAAASWEEAAGLIHPETLRELQHRELVRLECSGIVPGPPAVDEIVRAHPELPRAAAESVFQRMLRQREDLERRESLENRFPGFHTVDELAALTPREFTIRYLAGGRTNPPPWVHVGRQDTVFGAVREGRWIDVVYRHRYQLEEQGPTGDVELFRPPPKILRLRRTDGGWRVGYAGELLDQMDGGDMGPGVLPSMREECAR